MKRRLLPLLVAVLTLGGFLPGALANVSLLSASALSSSPSIEWSQTFGGSSYDEGYSVQQTSNGGYIIVGTAASFSSSNDIYLIKTDATGNMTWSQTFGGAGADYGYSVWQTAEGGYIVTGKTNSSGAGGDDVYLIKADASGSVTWERTLGGAGDDSGFSVQQTTDGGYIIAGYSNSFSAGDYDIYLLKTDASGNLAWQRTFGGLGTEIANSVQPTPDGGYIIGGWGDLLANGNTEIYLIKTDSTGNMVWQKTFGGSGNEDGGYIQFTLDGGYVIAGNSNSTGAGGYDAYLVKADSSGNLTWQQTYGGANDDRAYSVRLTADGGYIIAGRTNSSGAGSDDVYLIRIDPSGDMIWSQTYGGADEDWGRSVQATADGGYIIGGFTDSFGAGGRDFYLIKLAADAPPLPPPIPIPGDANGDGVVDAIDITKVERVVAHVDEPTPGADANHDGVINALDITKVERIIAGLD